MIITLERYFKVVHAIAHRKYYRSWMTKVGVVLPWIGGVCLILFPGMGTTRIVNGRCLRMGVWPNEAMAKVSTHVLCRIRCDMSISFCISCISVTSVKAFVFTYPRFECWLYHILIFSTTISCLMKYGLPRRTKTAITSSQDVVCLLFFAVLMLFLGSCFFHTRCLGFRTVHMCKVV